jgi:hypothetical protein
MDMLFELIILLSTKYGLDLSFQLKHTFPRLDATADTQSWSGRARVPAQSRCAGTHQGMQGLARAEMRGKPQWARLLVSS